MDEENRRQQRTDAEHLRRQGRIKGKTVEPLIIIDDSLSSREETPNDAKHVPANRAERRREEQALRRQMRRAERAIMRGDSTPVTEKDLD